MSNRSFHLLGMAGGSTVPALIVISLGITIPPQLLAFIGLMWLAGIFSLIWDLDGVQ